MSSEGVVSDTEGWDYEMESPVKSLIMPSWRYAVFGRWELRSGYPTRIVSDDDVEMLEMEFPKSWGGSGQEPYLLTELRRFPGGRHEFLAAR